MNAETLLKQLHEAATPPNWTSYQNINDEYEIYNIDDQKFIGVIAHECLLRNVSVTKANAALITALRNALPEIIALLEAVVDVDDAARRGLFAMSPPAVTYFAAMQDALAALDEKVKP